jgi:hypothetical protein
VIEFLQVNWLPLAFLAGIVIFFVLFRNRATKVDEMDAIWRRGEPVIVEVFNNT